MYTSTHLFLSAAIRRFLMKENVPNANIAEDFFLSGAIRPDRWSKSFLVHHLYSADSRAIRIYNRLNDADLTIPSNRSRHDVGVAMHYIQDALDRSKRLSSSKKTLFRDLQHCVTLGLFELMYDNSRVSLEFPSLDTVYNALSNTPKGIVYKCMTKDLDPSTDRKRQLSLTPAKFKKTIKNYTSIGYPPWVRLAFNRDSLLEKIKETYHQNLLIINKKHFQRSLRLQHQRIVYREVLARGQRRPRFWLKNSKASPENFKTILRFFAEDLGWILAFSHKAFESVNLT